MHMLFYKVKGKSGAVTKENQDVLFSDTDGEDEALSEP